MAVRRYVHYLARRLAVLYTRRGGSAIPTETWHFWDRLDAVRNLSFDELMHVVRTPDIPRGTKTLALLERALPLCDSVERIRVIAPYTPKTWKEEHATLLRKSIELINDKSELLRFLEEVGYIPAAES